MKRMILYLSLLLIVSLLSCNNEIPVDDDEATFKENVLLLLNAYRSSGCNCEPGNFYSPASSFQWNDILEMAAKAHTTDMYSKKFFDHNGSDGSNVGDRIRLYGYKWTMCAENIARGYNSEEQVIKAWISSSGHCRNIMNPYFKEIGLSKVGDYWTLVLGAQ